MPGTVIHVRQGSRISNKAKAAQVKHESVNLFLSNPSGPLARNPGYVPARVPIVFGFTG